MADKISFDFESGEVQIERGDTKESFVDPGLIRFRTDIFAAAQIDEMSIAIDEEGLLKQMRQFGISFEDL